jgi:integrase
VLAQLRESPTVRPFKRWAEAYRLSRVDIGDATRRTIAAHLKTMSALDDRDPKSVMTSDVQEWLGGLKLKPSSVRPYITTLRAVLDFAGVDPNPARDSRVRLPRQEQAVVDPPTAAEVETIIATVPKLHRLPLRVLEQTGMRIGELHQLEWGDVDEDGNRFRVREGKTASARRWVAVPDWLMREIAATVPREDRTPERRVFPGFTPDGVRAAMDRACRDAGIVHRHPHDLRHRYASLKIAEGVPVTTLAAQLGHSKKSLTLDVYSHVLIDHAR